MHLLILPQEIISSCSAKPYAQAPPKPAWHLSVLPCSPPRPWFGVSALVTPDPDAASLFVTMLFRPWHAHAEVQRLQSGSAWAAQCMQCMPPIRPTVDWLLHCIPLTRHSSASPYWCHCLRLGPFCSPLWLLCHQVTPLMTELRQGGLVSNIEELTKSASEAATDIRRLQHEVRLTLASSHDGVGS